MRCQKAREFCLKNRDGMLDEIEKMMLEKHVNSCPECAAYAKEMNCCLDLLCDMPELSPLRKLRVESETGHTAGEDETRQARRLSFDQ